MNDVPFPQPVTKELKAGDYYWVGHVFGATQHVWKAASHDFLRLEHFIIYEFEKYAKQRRDWEKQEVLKRTIPEWYKLLGLEIEFKQHPEMPWESFNDSEKNVTDWRTLKPSQFRAKPKPLPYVVMTVKGVEYRWKATLREGHSFFDIYQIVLLPDNQFHLAQGSIKTSPFDSSVAWAKFGPMVHGSDDYYGACRHLAALRALHEQE